MAMTLHLSIPFTPPRNPWSCIEGVDLVPSNIGLSSFEVSLVNTMSREFVLRSYLCEYLIKTYTSPGEVVADICAGSGTTAIAALNTGRD